jgi:hypothetical protein
VNGLPWNAVDDLTMHFSHLAVSLAAVTIAIAGWPNGPFRSEGPWILNNSDENVTYTGVNWPGAADTMVPEGLQYASISSIVAMIKELGMNVIRLTYAIEMIDDIYETGSDVTLEATFTKALGQINGTKVLNDVLQHNKQFSASTTRLEVCKSSSDKSVRRLTLAHRSLTP